MYRGTEVPPRVTPKQSIARGRLPIGGKAWPTLLRTCIGIPRGDRSGPPYGNICVDWRTWVAEGLVHELFVGELTGRSIRQCAVEVPQAAP